MNAYSEVSCVNVQKVEIDSSGNEWRILVDGKELDLSKIRDMEIFLSAGVIRLNATLIEKELPLKE